MIYHKISRIRSDIKFVRQEIKSLVNRINECKEIINQLINLDNKE